MPKVDLVIDPPLLNAAGFLGYAPGSRLAVDYGRLGAFVTNPISLERRSPARRCAYLPYLGGFLLHNGYPNPGLGSVIRRWGQTWAGSPLPVLVSLLPQAITQIPAMLTMLEGLPGVIGVEISLPPAGASRGDLLAAVQAAFGELPVALRLSPEQAMSLTEEVVSALLEAGLAVLVLGPPRGSLIDSAGRIVQGRLYGPSIYPLTLYATRKLAEMGLPIIAGGGVYQKAQVDHLIAAGAIAVLLDAALWRDPGFLTWGAG